MMPHRRWYVPAGLAVVVSLASASRATDVLNVRGGAKATVVQFVTIFPVQMDVNEESVPATRPEPPATARSRIDRVDDGGSITAGGQALALFDKPNTSGLGTPNDAGLDLGAFSDDPFTSWFSEGVVNEVRTLQLTQSDFSPEAVSNGILRVRSRVLLSGVMLIASTTGGRDLSGVRVNLSFSVTLRQEGLQESMPLVGEVSLVGTSDGDTQTQDPTGVLANLALPIVDFSGQIAELPFVRGLPFSGVNFPFEYEVAVAKPFELELAVRAQVNTTPDGVGAAAVFGTRQEGLGAVLSRVKRSDIGNRLTAAVSRVVDTTGQAYAATPIDAPPPATPIFGVCGAMGFEAMGLLSICGVMALRSFSQGGRCRGLHSRVRLCHTNLGHTALCDRGR